MLIFGSVAKGYATKKSDIDLLLLAYDFSKNQESLQIVGGYIESNFVPSREMIALAQLPSRQELFAKLAGALSAPISNFVYVQKANIKGLIYALEAIKKNQ